MTTTSSPKIVQNIENALGQAIASMTGKSISVAFEPDVTDASALENAITWQQSYSIPEGPSLWISAGKDLWEALGKVTLQAAGIEEVNDDDCRSTWQEILNQTTAGIATALTAAQSREVTASNGSIIESEPAGIAWQVFSVLDNGQKAWSFKAGWTKELGNLCEPEADEAPPVVRDASVSKTFDILLDVALPISVSFGRTSLQIREVLKLNTGSIVELDRFVSDPVEVIVNDCVIARGEVVVVDGNYGVRISQLASREDRLRTGMAEAAHKG